MILNLAYISIYAEKGSKDMQNKKNGVDSRQMPVTLVTMRWKIPELGVQ